MSESDALLPAEQRLSAHQASLRAQDAALDELSGSVRSVRGVAGALERETRAHNALLDGLEAGVERTGAATRDAARRTADAAHGGEVYTLKNFCMLLWPTVLLLVLALEAVIHFLF